MFPCAFGACVVMAHTRRPNVETEITVRSLLRFGLAALPAANAPLESLTPDQAAVGIILPAQQLGLYAVAAAFDNLPSILVTAFGTVALTRMISAIFRRGGDVSFVVEELKAVFDPQGGQWVAGRYIPSLLAAIGGVIETHMLRTGFMVAQQQPGTAPVGEPKALAVGSERPASGRGRNCPRCNMASLHRHEGCWVCDSCGYSKCG